MRVTFAAPFDPTWGDTSMKLQPLEALKERVLNKVPLKIRPTSEKSMIVDESMQAEIDLPKKATAPRSIMAAFGRKSLAPSHTAALSQSLETTATHAAMTASGARSHVQTQVQQHRIDEASMLNWPDSPNIVEPVKSLQREPPKSRKRKFRQSEDELTLALPNVDLAGGRRGQRRKTGPTFASESLTMRHQAQSRRKTGPANVRLTRAMKLPREIADELSFKDDAGLALHATQFAVPSQVPLESAATSSRGGVRGRAKDSQKSDKEKENTILSVLDCTVPVTSVEGDSAEIKTEIVDLTEEIDFEKYLDAYPEPTPEQQFEQQYEPHSEQQLATPSDCCDYAQQNALTTTTTFDNNGSAPQDDSSNNLDVAATGEERASAYRPSLQGRSEQEVDWQVRDHALVEGARMIGESVTANLLSTYRMLAEFEDKNNALKRELVAISTTARTAESKVAALSSKNEFLQTENAELAALSRTAHDRAATLSAKNESLQTENAELATAAQTAQDQLATLSAEKETLQTKAAVATEALTKSRLTAQKLKKCALERNDKATSEAAKAKSLEAKVDELTTATETAQDKVQSEIAKAKRLQSSVEQLQVEVDRLRAREELSQTLACL